MSASKPILHNQLCDELGIDYPIFLAGMGGRNNPTPPELVAAVSEAGGMGVLGVAALEAEEIRYRIREVRKLTNRPFGVDTLLPVRLTEAAPTRSGVRRQIQKDHPEHWRFMTELTTQQGLPERPVENELVGNEPFMRQQLDAILDEKVPLFVAALGDPGFIEERAHAQGMKLMGIAGNVRNARRQVEAGTDLVIAGGNEAGGHIGPIASFPLIPQLVDAIAPVPVVAAGGIADGRGVAAALALGAQAAWVGTAFLVADECGIPEYQKQQIIDAQSTDFVVSRAWTGKPTRSFNNPMTRAWAESDLEPLEAPVQKVLVEDFHQAAIETDRQELWFNPAGQIGGMLTRRRPAAEILEDMVLGAIEVLKGLRAEVSVA
ncbi:MAG TPA: nitronate monooxygenase family protein [Alphaproteobacteria bacterium]|jgi:NAD(P)H-dependent flavin oxidoreductase YrpB (nitropropane dioxygenase family)|nr:nitronate monooxygenase family protein [Alphaproteobacteria bacterium]MDP6270838.1 nitronate monooxygenase family protein [Alphaproteobacteria bacterium]MDP7163859.1 nitronate monooxygenase family protein [Alphaproteobacteria bacterium]MDP7428490.1 nitronate monooxygenase family protein [Alphaproteobacteria bacterium]HJM52089.1 nitronate monooxygenase family protein [Alphaproteobacteria bacterium]